MAEAWWLSVVASVWSLLRPILSAADEVQDRLHTHSHRASQSEPNA